MREGGEGASAGTACEEDLGTSVLESTSRSRLGVLCSPWIGIGISEPVGFTSLISFEKRLDWELESPFRFWRLVGLDCRTPPCGFPTAALYSKELGLTSGDSSSTFPGPPSNGLDASSSSIENQEKR